MLRRQKLDALRYKAVVDHTRTLVFEWSGTDLTYLSHRIPELLAGEYDGRNPFDVWREDDVLYAGDMNTPIRCYAHSNTQGQASHPANISAFAKVFLYKLLPRVYKRAFTNNITIP